MSKANFYKTLRKLKNQHKKIVICFVLSFFSMPFSFTQGIKISSLYENIKLEKLVEKYISSLSPMEAVSQLFMVNVPGNKVYEPVEEYIPGFVLLFSYNVSSEPREFISYVDSIYGEAKNKGQILPAICVDQEGGVVNRLKEITSPLPSQKKVSQTMSLKKAGRLYDAQAKQLKALGIQMNLAPVAEPVTVLNEDFLQTRSFGNLYDSTVYSIVEILAYEKNGVTAVVKHFPGNTNTDPHTGLPLISISREEFYNDYLKIFSPVLSSNPGAVLMSHAVVNSVDYGVPSCLSNTWITEVLKGQFNYDGLVVSDDVFMAALSKNGYTPEVAGSTAVLAGVDVIMISEKRFKSFAQLLLNSAGENQHLKERLLEAEKKVIMYKIQKGLIKLEQKADGSVGVTAGENLTSYADFVTAREKGRKIFEEAE